MFTDNTIMKDLNTIIVVDSVKLILIVLQLHSLLEFGYHILCDLLFGACDFPIQALDAF